MIKSDRKKFLLPIFLFFCWIIDFLKVTLVATKLPHDSEITKIAIYHIPYTPILNSDAKRIGVTKKNSQNNEKKAPGEYQVPVDFFEISAEKKTIPKGRYNIYKINLLWYK